MGADVDNSSDFGNRVGFFMSDPTAGDVSRDMGLSCKRLLLRNIPSAGLSHRPDHTDYTQHGAESGTGAGIYLLLAWLSDPLYLRIMLFRG